MTPKSAHVLFALVALIPAAVAQTAPQDGSAASETALARRFHDSVAVRRGPDRTEHVLYYFEPTAELAVDDELEQGSSAQSEITLPGGTRFELRATAHAIVRRMQPDGDVVELPLVTRAYVEAGDRPLTVIIPGGSRCLLRDTSMELRLDPGRIVVRNEGHEPVEVVGVISLERGETPTTRLGGRGHVVLERGNEVHLPLLGLDPVGRGVVVETIGRLTLRQDGGYDVESDGDDIVIRRASEDAAPEVVTVAGVRTWCEPGQVLRVASRRALVPTTLTRLSADDDAPAAPSTATANTVSTEKIVQALQKGISIETVRGTGIEITPAQEAEALALFQEAAATPPREKD